jgi:hypothetical protein
VISALLAAAFLSAQSSAPAPDAVQPASAAAGSAVAIAPKAQAAATTPTKVHRDDLVCKNQEVIGSRIPQRVCYTREQQEQREQEDKNNLNRLQSSQYMTHQQ